MRVDGTPVDLTPREFEILRVLLTTRPARHQGPAPARGLGRGVPGRGQLRLRPRQPAPPQARGRRPGRRAARPDRHRAGRRLPRPRAASRTADLRRHLRPSTAGRTPVASWDRGAALEVMDHASRPDGRRSVRRDPRAGDARSSARRSRWSRPGGAPRVVVAGLRFGDALLDPARARWPLEAGVRDRPALARRRDRRSTSPSSGSPNERPAASPVLLVEDDESLRRIVARHLRARATRRRGRPRPRTPPSSSSGGLRPVARPARPQPARRHRLGPAPRARPRGRRLPAGRHRQRDDGQPRAARASSACAGYLPKPFPLETLVATVERAPASGGRRQRTMTDLQILLIIAVCGRRLLRATSCCASGCAR